MALLSSATVLRLVDSMAILLAQAYQLTRVRLAPSGSPVLRVLVQRDQEATEVDLLRREVEVFRAQRESVPPNRRPTYGPAQRLAILQLWRLRGRSIKKTAEHFAGQVVTCIGRCEARVGVAAEQSACVIGGEFDAGGSAIVRNPGHLLQPYPLPWPLWTQTS